MAILKRFSLVIAVALAPVGVNVSALRVVRLARLTHFTRHLSHLRLLDLLGCPPG
jgi:hypothetical protein